MDSRILQVFYGTDCLPYKDKERAVHYPIVGGAFLGASNTTEIRFYIDEIGGQDLTWVAVAKLPNGKTGSKIITSSLSLDSELNEYYVVLPLSTWYTQVKGDVYINLQGYSGGVQVQEVDGIYELVGTPIIQATGSIKLNIAYATQVNPGDEIDLITLQDLMAAIETKLDKASSRYLKVIVGINMINNSANKDYLNAGDVVYDKVTKNFYVLSGTYPSLTYSVINLNLNDVNIGGNLVVSGDSIFEQEVRIKQGATYLTFGENGLVSLQDYLDEKQEVIPVIALNGTSGTINATLLPTLAKFPSYLTYEYGGDKSAFIHCRTDSNYYYFRKLFKESIHDNTSYLIYGGDIYIQVNKTTGVYSQQSVQYSWYSKSQNDTLLNAKADKSDTYTKNEIDTLFSSALVYQGTKTVAQINALDTSTLKIGYFYNISDSGVITLGSVDVLAGDNICWTGSGWDKLTMDLSVYDDKFIAAGFFEVQPYDEENGTITIVYSSDLYTMSYDTDTGILTIQAN